MNNTNNTTHQKDVSFKTFWRNNEHFADLFNATVFNGKQVLKPNKLTEMDTDVSATIQSKSYNESITRNRDVVKKMSDGVEFNILGLEIQDKTHYAMPLRTMTYDALGYIKEYNDIKKHHKLNKDSFSSHEEFLSGITRLVSSSNFMIPRSVTTICGPRLPGRPALSRPPGPSIQPQLVM